jgi:RHS repeat-associated protein
MSAVMPAAKEETRIRGLNFPPPTCIGPWPLLSSTLHWGSGFGCTTTPSATTDNRYYARSIGRFTTPDPYIASGGPADPQSWNRYSYVQNDPVNFSDPEGLMMKSNDCNFSFWGDSYCPMGGPWFGGYWWNGIEWEYPEIDPISPWIAATQSQRNKRRGQIDTALAAIIASVRKDKDGVPVLHWPAAIQLVDMCSTTGLNGGYELHVTYQVISELGVAMSGQQLAGSLISESFLSQTGNLGNLNLQAGTWAYPTSVDSQGQFTDILSSGGLPGFSRRGTALQEFTASGWFGVQPLDILGFGGISISGVNENYYSPELVTVNEKTARRSCN